MKSIIVDTPVWIDFFNKKNISPETIILRRLIENNKQFYICPVVYQEVLRGIGDNNLFEKMNLLALKGEVSRKRCISYEVRSVRKLFNCGVYYHFLLALLILTALKGGVLDPTANQQPRGRAARLLFSKGICIRV